MTESTQKYYHVVTMFFDDMEYVVSHSDIKGVIDEYILSKENSIHWMQDSIDISSDQRFAYCQGNDSYYQRMFIREISEAEALFLRGEWDIDGDNQP